MSLHLIVFFPLTNSQYRYCCLQTAWSTAVSGSSGQWPGCVRHCTGRHRWVIGFAGRWDTAAPLRAALCLLQWHLPAHEGRWWWWWAGTVSILQTGRHKMSPLAAVSLDIGLSVSAATTQPASTLSLPCTLRRTSKQRPGTPVQTPKCMKFPASRSSPLSPAHLCPAYMLICGVFFLSSCISF